jgi:murein DD-endopeptidase MepM/ murein hydrolase activator NlpD
MTSGFDVLGTIAKGGSDFSQWYTNMRMGEVLEAKAAADIRKAEKQATSNFQNKSGLSNDEIFKMFQKSIAQQESGGDHGALGTWLDMSYGRDRAYGKYQIMGNNIPAWTKEILGRSMTPEEFLKNQQAQEQVGKAKLWQAYKTYDSPKEAAMSWFGGAGGVANPYPAVTQYGKDIMGRMRDMGYSNRAANVGGGLEGSFVRPAMGSITSEYGWRNHPITGKRSFHSGADFGAPGGSPVRVMADGRIVEMEWDDVYGWNAVVKHGNGIRTQYSHLGKYNPKLEQGMKVNAGQRLGRVGSTGWSTAPHLHFEVERNGQSVNPLKYLRRNDAQPWQGGGGQQNIKPSSNSGRNRKPKRPPVVSTNSQSLNTTLNQYGLL